MRSFPLAPNFFPGYVKSNSHLPAFPPKFFPMPRSERARVAALIAAPHRVRENRTASHSTLVLQGAGGEDRRGPGRPRESIVLMKDGELTTAGRMYERLANIRLQAPPPWIGEPFLVGNNQWIRVDGGRRLLSTFIRGKEKLTTWGKKWYRENPEEYIVHVPVRITYRRRDKSHYEAPESTLPIEWRTPLHQEHDNAFYSTMLDAGSYRTITRRSPSTKSRCCTTSRRRSGTSVASA